MDEETKARFDAMDAHLHTDDTRGHLLYGLRENLTRRPGSRERG